jgi:hypothetical protein
MAKASNTQARQATKAPSNPDDRLIVDCLSVAADLAAIHAAFKTDPDDSNKYAEKFDLRHSWAARRTLKRINVAHTIPGLLAQARLLPMLLDDEAGSVVQETTLTFIRSFAVGVRDCLEQIKATGLHAAPEKEAAKLISA